MTRLSLILCVVLQVYLACGLVLFGLTQAQFGGFGGGLGGVGGLGGFGGGNLAGLGLAGLPGVGDWVDLELAWAEVWAVWVEDLVEVSAVSKDGDNQWYNLYSPDGTLSLSSNDPSCSRDGEPSNGRSCSRDGEPSNNLSSNKSAGVVRKGRGVFGSCRGNFGAVFQCIVLQGKLFYC